MQSPVDQSEDQTGPAPARPGGREDRLKAALKANMARRKAQAKARSAENADGQDKTETKDEG